MNEPLTAWQPEPQFRGTFTILTSCVSTLLICTWSALHADIQQGKPTVKKYADKGGWLIIGLLAPELILLAAINQYLMALSITKDAQIFLRPPKKGPSWFRRLFNRVTRLDAVRSSGNL